MTVPSALEISGQATPEPVTEIAAEAGRGAAGHMDIDAHGKVAGLA
jgi:hypothetical protein